MRKLGADREADLIGGGTDADHRSVDRVPVLEAPSAISGTNTLRTSLDPMACWSVDDVRFEFDSSFVKPEIAAELRRLAILIKKHAGARPSRSMGC